MTEFERFAAYVQDLHNDMRIQGFDITYDIFEGDSVTALRFDGIQVYYRFNNDGNLKLRSIFNGS